MAFTINHIVLVGGNLTRDAELKYASNGNARLTFSVAMNRSFKDASGQLKDVAEFFDVVYWGKLAEAVAPFLKKGQKVAIEGRLSQRRYTTQDGQQRNIVEVSATSVILIGARGESSQTQDTAYGPGEYEPAPGYAPRAPMPAAAPMQGQTGPRQPSTAWPGSQEVPIDDYSGHGFDDSPMEENDVPF